jgi:hypothetical protein
MKRNIKHYRVLLLSLLVSFPSAGLSQPIPLAQREPLWWLVPGTKIWLGARSESDNRAVVNLGQLKHVTAMAKLHLDTLLAPFGGAGVEITNLVTNFAGRTTSPAVQRQQNFQPVNAGQLKAVADLFYRRLDELGIDAATETVQRLGGGGYVSVRQGKTYKVPWSNVFLAGDNAKAANVGQLKLVFGFELDSDADSILDAFEWSLINANTSDGLNSLADVTAATAGGATGDLDGDGLTNAEEVMFRTSQNSAGIGSAPSALIASYDGLDRLTGLAGLGGGVIYYLDPTGNILSTDHPELIPTP